MTDFLSLPVYRHKKDILDALENNQVIIVESPTGSGKTTQIPLILKEANYDKVGIIGITQPRRIATLSICDFIKKQINDDSSYCAYTMRFDDKSDENTRIKIMTDGILLQEVKASPSLSAYSVLMVDEAHERSLNIDFILGLIKEILEKRKDLKVIISSATINAKAFSLFFNDAPIISIDSKPYPVDVIYNPLTLEKGNEEKYYSEIVKIVKREIENKDGGDILIFLSGENEIKDMLNALYSSSFAQKLEIHPLYGRLSKEEQEEVFIPTAEGKRKVVVSTNIAETSVTIDGIRTVIDSGMAKVNYYNQKTFTSALIPVSISRSSADQRKGRAGRTAPGVTYRLYSKENYEKRPEYSEEEILHSDLAEVVLRMSELGIYNAESFPFITQPLRSALKSAEDTLILIGAITENHSLTYIGEMMIKFPLLPRLSRVIVEAMLNYPEEIGPVITAVSFLSTKSPFILPPGEELEARDAHKSLSDKVYGDFISMLSLYQKFVSIKTKEEREQFCKSYFLDIQTLSEIEHIKTQLEDIVRKEGFPIIEGKSIADYFCCLASGLRQYVCKRVDKFTYRTTTAEDISIHPGSAWFRSLPDYILAGEIVKTSKLYARTVSPLRYEWISRIDPLLPEKLNQIKSKKVKTDSKDKKSATTKQDLAKYIKKVDNKNLYIIPLKDIENIKQIGNEKVYLSSGSLITKGPIAVNRLNREYSLIYSLTSPPLKTWPKGSFKIDKKDLGALENALNFILKTASLNDKNLGFLALTESKGRFFIRPYNNAYQAARESLFSLSELVDLLPKQSNKLREKANKILLRIIKKLELD